MRYLRYLCFIFFKILVDFIVDLDEGGESLITLMTELGARDTD